MPEELLDGVYDITCRETADGRYRAFHFADGTLVDTGLPDTTEALLDGIEATGVPVERVVVTHTDGDHVGGLDAVVEAHDPEVFLPVGADPEVASEIDHFYGDGDTVGSFEAVHMPGHRGHQHALVDEAAGVAVLADALSGADQRGLPQGYFHLPPGTYTDDLNRAEESLEKLLDYEFDAGLVFHGSSVLDGASERIAEYVY
jgi:glyoxylase-like metal-dependent hydrolase (beta-lactamase superfamily II)